MGMMTTIKKMAIMMVTMVAMMMMLMPLMTSLTLMMTVAMRMMVTIRIMMMMVMMMMMMFGVTWGSVKGGPPIACTLSEGIHTEQVSVSTMTRTTPITLYV